MEVKWTIMDTTNYSPDAEYSKAFVYLNNQLSILYSQASITFIFPLIAACCLALVLWDVASRFYLCIWLTLIFAHSVVRYILLWRFHRNEIKSNDADAWLNRFIMHVIISGGLWGAAGMLLIPYDNSIEFTLYNGLTILIICGLVSGALISYSINFWVFIGYSFPALIPPAIYLMSLGDRYNSTFGGFILLYYFFISVAASRMNKLFNRYMEIEHQQKELLFKYERLQVIYADFRRHLKI